MARAVRPLTIVNRTEAFACPAPAIPRFLVPRRSSTRASQPEIRAHPRQRAIFSSDCLILRGYPRCELQHSSGKSLESIWVFRRDHCKPGTANNAARLHEAPLFPIRRGRALSFCRDPIDPRCRSPRRLQRNLAKGQEEFCCPYWAVPVKRFGNSAALKGARDQVPLSADPKQFRAWSDTESPASGMSRRGLPA